MTSIRNPSSRNPPQALSLSQALHSPTADSRLLPNPNSNCEDKASESTAALRSTRRENNRCPFGFAAERLPLRDIASGVTRSGWGTLYLSQLVSSSKLLCPSNWKVRTQSRKMRCSVAFATVLLALTHGSRSFGIQVPAGGKSCFFREIHSSSHVSLHYVARETINVLVKSPSGSEIHSQTSVQQGDHSFDAQEDGPYEICVSTEAMRRIPTITKFQFLVFHPDVFSPDIAKSTQVFDARMLTHDVSKTAKKVLYATHMYSDTASATDETLKSSIALTGRLAALECIAVLVVALAQVTYIRNMLSATRSKLQRMV